jgi:hypothetical protein
MSRMLTTPVEAERRNMIGMLARWASIGIAIAAAAGTFAYFGGWFGPDPLTPAKFIDSSRTQVL